MRVYKFLSLQHATDNLIKRRIKISEYEDMNDPFELGGSKASNAQYQKVMTEVVKKHGVLCFSTVETEPILWSHYAEKHRGCCIGLDVDWPLEPTIPVDVPQLIPVDIARLEGFYRDAVHSGRFPIEEGDPEIAKLAADPAFDEITKRVLFSKYSGWTYEREVRLLITLRPEQKDGMFYFADFDEGLKPFEVLLGARCTEEHKEKLWYAVNRYDPPLPIVRTDLANDAFKIVRVS